MKLDLEYCRSNKVEEDAKSPSPTPNQENFLRFDESQIDSQVEFRYSFFIPQCFCWPGTVFIMHLSELGQNYINFCVRIKLLQGIHTSEGVPGCLDAFIISLVLKFVALVLQRIHIFLRNLLNSSDNTE